MYKSRNSFITNWPALFCFQLGLQIQKTTTVLLNHPINGILLQMLQQTNIPTSLLDTRVCCLTCANCSYLFSCSPPISNNSGICGCNLFSFLAYSLNILKSNTRFYSSRKVHLNRVSNLNFQLHDLFSNHHVSEVMYASAFHTVFT